MNKIKISKSGVVLFITLATILITVVLANVIMSVVSSQAALTRHQVSRTQAYYVAMAGINLAYEKLRTGNDADWPLPNTQPGSSYTRCICKTAVSCNASCAGTIIVESALPSSINSIVVTVTDAGAPPPAPACTPPAGVPICIRATSDYLYSP